MDIALVSVISLAVIGLIASACMAYLGYERDKIAKQYNQLVDDYNWKVDVISALRAELEQERAWREDRVL